MFLFPIGTDRPQRRFPWMNVLIIGANIIIFLISYPLSRPHGPINPEIISLSTGLYTQFDRYLLNPTDPHLWQFITYQFLHQGPSHIIFNMLFLYVFGNNLNEKLGNAAYLAFYLAGGVLAGCGQMLASPHSILGASGSISAVCGLFLILLPRTHIRIFVTFFFLFVDVWEIPSMFFILFKIGGDVLEPFIDGGQVAYVAHLTGTLVGILVGLLLLATHLVQRDHYDLLSLVNRYRRRKTYESMVAAGYNPFNASAVGTAGINAMARKTALAAAKPVDPRIDPLRAEISQLIREHQLDLAAQRYLDLHAIDSSQVLASQDQLDVANQLMAETKYMEAADAYEDYLRVYPTAVQHDQIKLILGLIYSRYYPKPDRARQLFTETLPRLHDPNQRELAQFELDKLGPASPI